MTDFWQSLLVYLLVLWCFWRAVKKFAPNGVWQMQARLSYAFESRNSGWLKHIGRALRPAIAIPAGCNSHCTNCKTCA